MHAPLLTPSRLALSEDGSIEGYASLFGAVDQARDMVMPGAFAQTLKSRGVRKIPMLFQHDPGEPVGIWLELAEDFRGLRACGKLIPEVARGRELLALLREGAIDGLSIGYLIVDRVGVRVLRDPYSAKPYVLFYTTKRVGGGVQDFDAIKLLKFSAS
ncbi:MAG TPA: HK97 family phage prohead protease [Rhodopseudomonas sp.]|uniref:HK97 family phage prohead protease n=1 Tax=Rhodopseudomonas sp. TaxID=1078 RepID=UPI002EDA30BE